MVDWPTQPLLKLFVVSWGYVVTASPLTTLLKKDAFRWSIEAQTAFDTLKKAMTEAPILALPNFDLPFVLEIDASGVVMGAILMQEGHPIAFHSKPFCPKLMRSSTYVHELHAITSTVKKWRQYLLEHSFTILTDQRSLKELMSQIIQTPEQQVYLSKLLGFDYSIQYKAGKTNVVVDALLRPQHLGVATGNRDGTTIPKETVLKRVWSRHHSLFWKTMEQTKKNRHGPRKPDSGFGSRLRVRKVLAPYNACPKAAQSCFCLQKGKGGANSEQEVAGRGCNPKFLGPGPKSAATKLGAEKPRPTS
ncbi:hypothetical protein V8G54_013601 [Vigna mungo]|uniref:Reverse transcriptase/retrotransposon-derived protein RNase H-like domain-containing protein n=1 Tax=Vigna mungo TaxID=3915 RepID=A0AAQ3NTN6_VIGMU